jgi:hypothetical protein
MAGLMAIKFLALFAICGLGPGSAMVGRLRFSPLEKLCAAFAISFVAIYLAGFALFCVNAPISLYECVSAVCAACAFVGRRQLGLFLRNRQTRTALIAFVGLVLWDFLHLAIIQYYNAADWSGDWLEHYQRTGFFLNLYPPRFQFINVYLLPARPPMMNVIAAFFCKQIGFDFRSYSLCALFLNAFAFLPCCLLLRMIWAAFLPPPLVLRGRAGEGAGMPTDVRPPPNLPRSTRGGENTAHGKYHASRAFYRIGIPTLAILFMLNPSILENVTFVWTKAFSAAFVVIAVCFYLRGLRRKSASRIFAAFVSLAAGILVHYSSAPFAIAIGLHYGWQWIVRRRLIREIVLAGGISVVFLSTWFAWSLAVFGWHDTFLSNTTAAAAAGTSASETLNKFLHNLFVTFIPHPLHYALPPTFWEILPLAKLRDYYFLMSQDTLPMMIGVTGGVIAIVVLVRRLWRAWPKNASAGRFWIFFLATSTIIAIATNPDRTVFGCAHVVLQPLALIGVTLLASALPFVSRPVVVFWTIGCITDYALGILLNFHLQTQYLSYVPVKLAEERYKTDNGLIFWGDQLAGISTLLQAVSILLAAAALIWLLWAITKRNTFSRQEKKLQSNHA